ncbi:MAG: SDR family NAD(P)-dependent oxidoreductase [Albidovulum sp.]|nr:SDR family NAD(P)-dependent oxidoreductase [Albidovulum sp.]MDE0531347.1 SDR family NAD(P)-dependent oxidoreductase [Albidovulum sp.]
MTNLSGRKALVTGARHGLGAAIAREFAANGASVAVCGRAEGDCDSVAAEIEALGGAAFDHRLNLDELESASNQMTSAVEKLGGLDILVNNAAVIEPMARIGSIEPADFDLACRINLSGPLALTNAAWRMLSGGGRVLNVLSGASIHPMEGWAAYCSSKAGLHMLTKMIDLEGRDSGVRGFGFAPGLVDTPMQGLIRDARINRISDVPREQLADPAIPARMAAWIVSGEADDLAGGMIDIRDSNIRRRIGWNDG